MIRKNIYTLPMGYRYQNQKYTDLHDISIIAQYKFMTKDELKTILPPTITIFFNYVYKFIYKPKKGQALYLSYTCFSLDQLLLNMSTVVFLEGKKVALKEVKYIYKGRGV